MTEITTQDRREFARLRSLLINPGSVQLLHSGRGSRVWLTDEIVLLDVTGSPAVDADSEDGLYRLVGTKGLIRKPGIPTVNLAIWLSAVTWAAWLPAWPSGFSVTDSEAKAMLVYVDAVSAAGRTRIPLAMNEDIWHAFKAAYPDAALWHAGYGGPFRVSVLDNDELAYIQAVRIPGDIHKVVQAMVDAMNAEAGEDGKNGTAPGAAGTGDRNHPLEQHRSQSDQ